MLRAAKTATAMTHPLGPLPVPVGSSVGPSVVGSVKRSICCLKCYYDEKCCSRSLDSDSIFGKIVPCQLLRLNFKNKSNFFSYDFSLKLSAITRFCSSRVALRELDRERK